MTTSDELAAIRTRVEGWRDLAEKAQDSFDRKIVGGIVRDFDTLLAIASAHDAALARVRELEGIKAERDDDFWRELIYKDGKLDEQAVFNELADYRFLLAQVPVVYDHVTGGRMSYTTYYAKDVIREHDDVLTKEREEAFNEGKAEGEARVRELEAIYEAEASLTRHVRAERDWLAKRAHWAGICNFGPDRDHGISSNAMVEYALGGPLPRQNQYPWDDDDLESCQRCRNGAPEHLRARMDEVLELYRQHLLVERKSRQP